MGVKLKDIAIRKEITFGELQNKIIAIDAYNMLYQFLSSIRQGDGSYLTDGKGQVTSHLVGLFSRMSRLLLYGIRPVLVFDGTPHDLKRTVLDSRKQVKERAKQKYELALREGDMEGASKYARQMSKLTPEMVKEAKDLLDAMGVPYLDAPSEGEAEAARLCREGLVFAAASQDYDALLFGSPLLIQNLTLSQKKKSRDKLSYQKISPELISLRDTLGSLGISHDQLIIVGILTGTDYAPKGIPGLGPKKALAIVREYGSNLAAIRKRVNWDEQYPELAMEEIFSLFKLAPADTSLAFSFRAPSLEKLTCVLCERHDFSVERVKHTYDELVEKGKTHNQRSLGEF